ncbi:MAG TPA: hypothetical protein VFQ51_02855 [Vicinamibacteria bacterium]|nr:hypothetical protein [Vicinamibacteria bacterium]
MMARSLLFAGLASCVAMPAAAQNQAVNPHFLNDLSGWIVFNKPLYNGTYDPSQGFNTPGALRINTTAATVLNFVVVRQCLPVVPTQVVDFGGKYRFESGHAANLKGFASVLWFTNTTCTAPAGLPLVSTNTVNDIPDTWLPVHANDVVVPATANSAFFQLAIQPSAGEARGWFDDVYFGPDPLTPVELQDFRVE